MELNYEVPEMGTPEVGDVLLVNGQAFLICVNVETGERFGQGFNGMDVIDAETLPKVNGGTLLKSDEYVLEAIKK